MKPVVIFSLSALATFYIIAAAQTIMMLQNSLDNAAPVQPTISGDANLVRPE